MHFTIRITKAHLKMGLEAGDLVTFEPEVGSPECPVFIHRRAGENILEELVLLLGNGGAKPLTPMADSFVRAFEAAAGAARLRHPPGEPFSRFLSARSTWSAPWLRWPRARPGLPNPGRLRSSRRKGPWPDAGRRLHLAQDRIRCRTPRPCRVCGKEFAGQLHAVTCRACKAAGQRRCCACGEVFKGAPKAKRCPGCLEKYAALEAERTRTKERGEG